MKRIHLHVSVPDLGASIQFYETLFGAAPVVVKDDYAKWMLDDHTVNFAISDRARAAGLDPIGIQVDRDVALGALPGPLTPAGARTFYQATTPSHNPQRDKHWIPDT